MSTTERSVLKALVELEQAVQSMRAGQLKPNLLPFFGRIDELTRELPKETDPTLLHYLQRKSYEKARAWLENRDAENQAGECRH